MARKRSLSDSGDAGNSGSAVLRLSQGTNSSSLAQNADPDDGSEGNGRRMNSARLYAQSLQKMNPARKPKSKRLKLSDVNSAVDRQSSEDGRVIAGSYSACEQSFDRMSVNGCSESSTANESSVSD